MLLDEIKQKHLELKNHREKVTEAETGLYPTMTFMRKTVLKWSIHRLNEGERLLVQKRHDKKFANLMKEKAEHEGKNENPNEKVKRTKLPA